MNYGTILQAFAMQRYLENELKCSAAIINYIPVRKETISNELSIWQRVNRKADYICDNAFRKKYKELFTKKRQRFFSAIDDTCCLTSPIKSDDDFMLLQSEFDAFICGSDQIWNPYWMDPNFYLSFVKSKKKIAYAPSIGIQTIPDNFFPEIKRLLSGFHAISVREKNGSKQIESIISKKVSNVCDPVFLLDKSYWMKYIEKYSTDIKQDYVFYYLLSYHSEHWRAIKRFASERGLKIVGIPVVGREFYFYRGEKIVDAGPFEFLKLLSSAKYVLTDSFHATSFSIILEKQFYVFERFSPKGQYSQNSRVNSLLEEYGLTNRLLKYCCTHITENKDIDYGKVKKEHSGFIEHSKIYLKHALYD